MGKVLEFPGRTSAVQQEQDRLAWAAKLKGLAQSRGYKTTEIEWANAIADAVEAAYGVGNNQVRECIEGRASEIMEGDIEVIGCELAMIGQFIKDKNRHGRR